MIYIQEDYLEFSEKHDIVPQSLKCEGCGLLFETSVPIRIKGYAGLEIPAHGCDRKFLAATFVPIDEDGKKFWRQVV